MQGHFIASYHSLYPYSPSGIIHCITPCSTEGGGRNPILQWWVVLCILIYVTMPLPVTHITCYTCHTYIFVCGRDMKFKDRELTSLFQKSVWPRSTMEVWITIMPHRTLLQLSLTWIPPSCQSTRKYSTGILPTKRKSSWRKYTSWNLKCLRNRNWSKSCIIRESALALS